MQQYILVPIAKKTFKRNEGLIIHMNQAHSNKEPYKCDDCSKVFWKIGNFNRHKAEVHERVTRGKLNSYKAFFENLKYGPIFACISCHMANYIASVQVFDENLQMKISPSC